MYSFWLYTVNFSLQVMKLPAEACLTNGSSFLIVILYIASILIFITHETIIHSESYTNVRATYNSNNYIYETPCVMG